MTGLFETARDSVLGRSVSERTNCTGNWDPHRYSNTQLRKDIAWRESPDDLCALDGNSCDPIIQPSASAARPPPADPTIPTTLFGPIPEHNRRYPFNLVGYQPTAPCPLPPPKAKSYSDIVEQAQQNCKTCPTAQPDLVPLGCSIIPNDQRQAWDRRPVNAKRPFPGETFPGLGDAPIYITPASWTRKDGAPRTTPLYGQYTGHLFETPIDRSDNFVSSGVMVNSWTGEVMQTFENQIPPPNTDKSIDPDRFKVTNPKLIQMFGGLDPNRPLPTKREVCQDIPGPDAGNNVWGDQLYEGKRRARLADIANRDIWMNRDGIYACELSLNGEKPAGYVGLQPAYRGIPYLPPTQILDNKDWKPDAHWHVDPSATNPLTVPLVETRRSDLSNCPRQENADAPNGVEAEMPVPVTVLKPTWRGQESSLYSGPAEHETNQPTVPQDLELRTTQKGLMQEEFPVEGVYPGGTIGSQGYVVLDTDLRETQKGLMQEEFPTEAVYPGGTIGSQAYVVLDTDLRDTQKGLMQEEFPVEAVYPGGTIGSQAYVVLDTDLRETQKGLMQEEFPQQFATGYDQSNGPTGSYIEFQGPLNSTRRRFYADVPREGFVQTEYGEFVGNGDVTSSQFRGTYATDYIDGPSRVPAEVGDTDSTWIGHSTRVLNKQTFMPRTTAANLTEFTVPRWRPLVNPSCKRPDDVDDEFLHVRPTYFGENMAQG